MGLSGVRRMLLPLPALPVFSGCSAPAPAEPESSPEGPADTAPARYIPDVSADAAYQDGVFTLWNFHLYGNYIKERQP